MKKILRSVVIVCAIILTACGPTEEKTNEINLSLTAEGPFFAGPNSLIIEYDPDVKSIIGSDKADLKDLQLKNILVNLPENSPYSWTDFASASIVFVSNNIPMTSIAILNPIESEGNTITLTTSEEAELVDFFLEENFNILLDLDFIEDSYEDAISADLQMNLTFKY